LARRQPRGVSPGRGTTEDARRDGTDYLVQIDGSSVACEIKGVAPSDKRDKIWDWSKGGF